MESRYKNVEMGKLLAEVKKNQSELDSCSKHDFSIDVTEGQSFSKKWKCTACGGEVDTRCKLWYEKGLEHQGKGL